LRILLRRATKQAREGVHLRFHESWVARLSVEQVGEESICFGGEFSSSFRFRLNLAFERPIDNVGAERLTVEEALKYTIQVATVANVA